jgi:hypothetical protein
VAVYVGVATCCGNCANAAIATKDLDRFNADHTKPTNCKGVLCPAIACAEGSVACNNNVCAFVGGPQ